MSNRKYPVTANENIEQMTLMSWANLQRGTYPELDLLFHIPNGGHRNKAVAAKLKKEGVKAGVPDLCLPVPKGNFHGLYIEMKAHSNQPTAEQKQWLCALAENGYCASVCWGWEQAAQLILKYLNEEEITI